MAFNCTTHEPATEAFKQISSHHGIIFLKDVAEVVQAAQDRGEDVSASDEHWNGLGSKKAGEVIASHLSLLLRRSASAILH